jgi:hypothetical protein
MISLHLVLRALYKLGVDLGRNYIDIEKNFIIKFMEIGFSDFPLGTM